MFIIHRTIAISVGPKQETQHYSHKYVGHCRKYAVIFD